MIVLNPLPLTEQNMKHYDKYKSIRIEKEKTFKDKDRPFVSQLEDLEES